MISQNFRKLLAALLAMTILAVSTPVNTYAAELKDTISTVNEAQDEISEESGTEEEMPAEINSFSVSGNEIMEEHTTNEEAESTSEEIQSENIQEEVITEEISVDMAVYGDDYPAEYKNAAMDSVIDRWNFYNRECTSFAAWCLNSRNGISFTNWYGGVRWGNAKNWGLAAQNLGITVDMNPAKGSIYWSNSGTYGHVAWVSDVVGSSVTLEEYNYPSGGRYNTRSVASNTASGYIHIQDIPTVIIGADMPDGGLQTILDGDYYITTALDSNMCLDIAGPSFDNGANAQIHHSTEADNQIFTVTYLGKDKGYKIIHKYTGKSLDVAGASREMGANVWQWEYYDPSEHTQQWVINEIDHGAYYTIQSRGSGFYLDVCNGEAADCTNVQIWEGNGSNAQKWRFIPAGTQTIPDGDYHIITALDENMCLSIQDASLENEANAQISHSAEDNSQIFTVTYLGNGIYKIIYKLSDKSLDVFNAEAVRGTNVQQFNYHGGRSQQWIIRTADDNTYTIQARCSGHYLDVADGQTAEKTNVWMTVGNGSSAQKWKFTPVTEKKLDAPTASPASGTEVEAGAKISLSCNEDAAIYYTLDGTKPNIYSLRYTEPILIEKDTIITAYAVKKGYTDSDTVTFFYTIPVISGADLGDVLEEDVPLGNVDNIPQGLWMSAVTSQTYTGQAIKPSVRVYDHKTLLTEKKDYTISYKNNIKVNHASKAGTPTITVTGKGNYTGKELQTFVIKPKLLSDEDVITDDITLQYTGKLQKPVPVITWNGQKLVKNKDYTVSYPNEETNGIANPGAYIKTGTYTILVKGLGNYTGEKNITLTITDHKSASKLTVAKIADQTYTGNEIKPVPVVKDGRIILTEGKDYKLSYQNNIKTGTATITITGIGDYAGTKKVHFKIMALESLNRAQAKIEFNNAAIYTGKEVKPDKITLTINVKKADSSKMTVALKEGIDYETVYQNNINAGTATVIFKGINGYSGTLKKTYKIAAYDINTDEKNLSAADKKFKIEMSEAYEYTKGGCKPEPVITFQGKILTKGTDYTLNYRHNTSVNNGSDKTKLPAVIIKGKGCFKGSCEKTYLINPKNISKLTLTASDKTWQNKKNIYKTKITVKDSDGKALLSGKDYDSNVIYEYGSTVSLPDGTVRNIGEKVSANDILPAGTIIKVTITAKGNNYTGSLSGNYRIAKADISKAKITIPTQIYTGKPIEPDHELTVKLNNQILSEENYEIVQYDNNINTGTATVTIKGKNDCGGIKNAKFKIKGKGLLWWWR